MSQFPKAGRSLAAAAAIACICASSACTLVQPSTPGAAAFDSQYYDPRDHGLARFTCTLTLDTLALNGHPIVHDGKFLAPPGRDGTPAELARMTAFLRRIGVQATVRADGSVDTTGSPLPVVVNRRMRRAAEQIQRGLALTGRETLTYWAWLTLSRPLAKSPPPEISRTRHGYVAKQRYGAQGYTEVRFDGDFAMQGITLHDPSGTMHFATHFDRTRRGYVLASFTISPAQSQQTSQDSFRVHFTNAVVAGYLLPRRVDYAGKFLGVQAAGAYSLSRCIINAPGPATVAAPSALTAN